jgi:hypothetical protein
MFSVEHLTNINDSFVVFEAAQFDSYGYLFREPFFISLDGTAQPDGIDVRGLRVGLNGAEARVGQAYSYLDTEITTAGYSVETGQPLSRLGTVLPLEKGPEDDEFFLTFDTLGANVFNRPPPVVPPASTPQDLAPASVIGVRTFDEISATMAKITDVSQRDASVSATFGTIRQSLPATENIESVLGSHQVAIAQLAIEYCHALMENRGGTTRETMFPGFQFGAVPATAYAGENLLIDPLLNRVLGVVQLAHQPDKNAVRAELSRMINGIPGDATRPGLLNTGTVNDAARTRNIAKAVCSTVIGSAAMLVQ